MARRTPSKAKAAKAKAPAPSPAPVDFAEAARKLGVPAAKIAAPGQTKSLTGRMSAEEWNRALVATRKLGQEIDLGVTVQVMAVALLNGWSAGEVAIDPGAVKAHIAARTAASAAARQQNTVSGAAGRMKKAIASGEISPEEAMKALGITAPEPEPMPEIG